MNNLNYVAWNFHFWVMSSIRVDERERYVTLSGIPRMRPGMTMANLTRLQVRPYLTYEMKTTISSKGQIVLPAELRAQDSIEPGEEFTVERVDRGEYRLVRRTPPRNEGLVDWLLACPEKGFFVAIESESTDAL